MDWKIRISGNKIDLKMLSKSFEKREEFSLEEESDGYYLGSKLFESMINVNDVKRMAQKLISALNGAVILSMESREPINIEGITSVDDEGAINTFLFYGEHICLSDRISITLKSSDGTIEEILPTDSVSDWLVLSLNDPNVAKVMRLIVKDGNSWVGIYRIYEVIVDDFGDIAKFDWVTKTNIKRFTHTANSVAITGDDARHGKETTEPPKDPMTITEAKAFVNQVMHNWLALKLGQNQNS